jgi:hypothetical protein
MEFCLSGIDYRYLDSCLAELYRKLTPLCRSDQTLPPARLEAVHQEFIA